MRTYQIVRLTCDSPRPRAGLAPMAVWRRGQAPWWPGRPVPDGRPRIGAARDAPTWRFGPLPRIGPNSSPVRARPVSLGGPILCPPPLAGRRPRGPGALLDSLGRPDRPLRRL